MLMLKTFQHEYRLGFILSLALHVAIGIFLVFSIQQGVRVEALAQKKGDIVQAVIIDESQVAAEVQRLQMQQKTKEIAVAAELAKASEARKAREQEQIKLDKLKQEMAKAKLQETERLSEIKLAKEKEKKQLESLRQEKEKEQKKIAALDDQRQAEQDRVNQMRTEREKEEKKKEHIRNQAEAKRVQDEANKQAGLKAAALAAENQSRILSEAERILLEWRESVRNNRRETLELPADLECKLAITLLPDGSFREVRLLQSSGNSIFDDSVVHAVYKTPVPMPEDVAVRDALKTFTLSYTNIE